MLVPLNEYLALAGIITGILASAPSLNILDHTQLYSRPCADLW